MSYQLHVSGLSLLGRCGIAFERRYVNRERGTRSPSLVVGTAVDRATALDLREKLETEKLLPADAVRDAARDALNAEWDQGDIQIDEVDTEEGWSEKRGDAVDASVGLAGLYHTEAAPGIVPLAIQRQFVMDVHGAVIPLQIAGTIDVQEPGAIRDTKTSGKSPKKDAADESLQLTMYSLALRQIDGELPGLVVLDYVVRTPKRHDLKLIQLESTRTEADLQPLAQRIHSAARILKAGIFTPADPASWWCSKKYCSFWQTCPYAVRPVSALVNGTKVQPIDEDLVPLLQASIDQVKRRKAAPPRKPPGSETSLESEE